MASEFLHGVEVVEVSTGTRPISVVKSSVIGLIGTAGKGDFQKPVLIAGRRTDGVLTFGEYKDDGFTIPEALDGIFDQTAPLIVVVNVIDRGNATFISSAALESLTFDSINEAVAVNGYQTNLVIAPAMSAIVEMPLTGLIPLPPGVTVTDVKDETGATTFILDTDYEITGSVSTGVTIGDLATAAIQTGDALKVEYTATAVLDTDFTHDADNGAFVRIDGGVILPEGTISISYDWVDPSGVTEANIIGGITGGGEAEGNQNFLKAKSEVGASPRLLIAPRFTSFKPDSVTANAVVADLLGIAERLKAIIIADAPDTTKEDAIQYRNDYGSQRVYIHYPFYKVLNPDNVTVTQPASARIAGLIAKVDNEEGYWNSPSNHFILGIQGVSKPIDFSLNDKNTVANLLNENEVTTTIREEGFRLWGNRTTSSDPLYAFISVRRTADIVQESILFAHLWAVDKNINKGFVDSIVDGVNNFLRTLKTRGAIAGGQAWADPALNTPDVIAAGELFIDFDFTAFSPAEHITFRSHLVDDYLVEIFD